jgi:hypothetical protein
MLTSVIILAGVPAAMKIIDIMGIDMARNEWACASLNEFRSFLKLTRYNSFEGEYFRKTPSGFSAP